MIIAPYKDVAEGGWYFDAPELGVFKEALIRGADALLDEEVSCSTSALVEFSDGPFPGAAVLLTRERSGLPSEEYGTWYRDSKHGRAVWLCDTLSLYFAAPPDKIYVRLR